MRIKKRCGEFRGKNRCHILREHEDLNLSTVKNVWYDNAVIVKDIMKGYLKGEFTLDEFYDLVSQGVEDDYLTEESGRLRRERLVKCLQRAARSETRIPVFPSPKTIPVGNYDVVVAPDVVFDDGETLEVVLYRAGKPSVTMKGRMEDTSVGKCLELYFLHLYGRSLVKEGEYRNVRASYYFMRKTTDTKDTVWDDDFFSEQGGNVVYLEQVHFGGQKIATEMDLKYLNQLNEYEKGRLCEDDECKSCYHKNVCEYQKSPEPYETKAFSGTGKKVIPSKAQKEVIDFKEGVCRVDASAGSGKTETVTERGVRMIEEGCDVSKLLFITFTEAGTYEMKERLLRKCKERDLPVCMHQIEAMTFNSFAYRIVCQNYEECGFTKPPVVLDEVRNAVLITQLLDETKVAGLDYLNFRMDMPNLRGALSCAAKVFTIIKEHNIDTDDMEAHAVIGDVLTENGYQRFIPDAAITQLMDLYEEYDRRLKEENLLQYADQEPMMHQILNNHPGYLERFGYEHIVVDEFQDSNDIQMVTIKRLMECSSFKSLLVVGDDSQSIFGFRNTSQENIIHFFEKIGRNGRDIFLTENRRSIPEILELANKINDLNEEKIEKQMLPVRESGAKPIVKGFHSKQEEYQFIADEAEKLIHEGLEPSDIAVIAATKAELVLAASELSIRKIPWVMKNPMILKDNSRVQSAMSLAEAFYQPDAEILYFNYLISKYDGDIFELKTTEDIRAEVEEMKQLFISIDSFEMEQQRNIFHELLEDIRGTDEIYEHFLSLVYANEDLSSELDYIHKFNQFGDKMGKKLDQSYVGVVLTTAHSSKGLEWKAVFNTITKYDAKSLHTGKNKQKAIEEKRRLLFVSMTRARDLLYVTGQYIAFGNKKDGYVYNQFLKEVFEASGQEFHPEKPEPAKKRSKSMKKAS